ncbi:hypothetical protein EDD29_6653 [Actinocorallia herbida]|uniref:Uncharacterized protein n=1 Tax=Actinocorallia herbida TaxID=58109 RepID=A0A3N1D681_9ACTN|nr:hypothetical protein [Actinocorallia herbida]ROO88966.1 hypothetical protein EDD29_6653 [Actinocorallia herbida]
MTELLLTLHVLAALLAIGPMAVASSLFPRQARDQAPTTALLHRICRGYSLVGLAIPVFGFATALALDVLTAPWLLVSIVLTALAAGVLAFAVLPAQRHLLDVPSDAPGTAARLHMTTGIFNLLWAAVAVLMVTRPGA